MPNQKISELPNSDILYANNISGNKFYTEELTEQEKIDLVDLRSENVQLLDEISSLQMSEISVESDISSLQVDRSIFETNLDGFTPTEQELAELDQIYEGIESLELEDINIEYDISSLQMVQKNTTQDIHQIELKTADKQYLLIARENYRNEKISFKNLHRSILEEAVYLKSDQTIRGEKTFADPCVIKKRSNFTEIQDPSIEGSISGYSFLGRTGFFENSLSNFPDIYPEINNLGSTFCEQNLDISGSLNLFQDLKKEQSLNTINLTSNKDSFFTNYITGSSNLYTQNLICSGNLDFKLNLDCLGEMYIEHQIVFPGNKNIDFSNNRLNFSNNLSSELNISNEIIEIKDDLYMHNSTVNIAPSLLNIETQGSLNIAGEAYVDKIYSKYNTEYKSIIAGADESIQFRAQVEPNSQQQKIYFPKTFHNPPIVHCTLENSNNSTDFCLLSVSESFIEIKLNQPTSSNGLYLNIFACSTSEYSPNKDSIVRFTTNLYATNYFLVGFPIQQEIPLLLNQLEADAFIKHSISSVTKQGFAIRFANTLPNNSKLHTILTNPKKQRLN